MAGEEEKIFVVSGSGKGHVNPCLELCNRLTLRNYQTTLLIPSSTPPLSPSPNPLVSLLPIAVGPCPGAQDLEAHLMGSAHLPLCAVVDFQMGWTKTVFWKLGIPVVGLFTFGACAAAMEFGAWKAKAGGIGLPGHVIDGLPEEMAFKDSDLKRRPGPAGPPEPGDKPPWVSEVEGSIGLMFNTCDDLERPFIEYMARQMKIPAWGVGPLLPSHYWESPQDSNDADVIEWLDENPRGSVLYVAFGSEVGPTTEEQESLARALESSTRPFIWAARGNGVKKERLGERGLVIRGWAPQAAILAHPSTGGFLSHCGWNSTAEALGRGVPLLTWPMRGDQYYNAKLAVDWVRVGHRVKEDMGERVRVDDVAEGIERLMGDGDMRERAKELARRFQTSFVATSARGLDDFRQFLFITKKGNGKDI